MASANTLMVALIELMDDKKRRGRILVDMEQSERERLNLEAVRDKYLKEQQVLEDTHNSIKKVDEAEAMWTKAADTLETARVDARKTTENAKQRIKNLQDEYNDWHEETERKEVDVAKREAMLVKNTSEQGRELTNREAKLEQSVKAVEKREAAANTMFDEYRAKFDKLKSKFSGFEF